MFQKAFTTNSLRIAIVAVVLTALALPAVAADASPGQININKASVDQLTNLPRVGKKVAERIVQFREDHGAFQKKEELMGVKGIGEKTFDLMLPYLSTTGETTLNQKVKPPRVSQKATSKKEHEG